MDVLPTFLKRASKEEAKSQYKYLEQDRKE